MPPIPGVALGPSIVEGLGRGVGGASEATGGGGARGAVPGRAKRRKRRRRTRRGGRGLREAGLRRGRADGAGRGRCDELQSDGGG